MFTPAVIGFAIVTAIIAFATGVAFILRGKTPANQVGGKYIYVIILGFVTFIFAIILLAMLFKPNSN